MRLFQAFSARKLQDGKVFCDIAWVRTFGMFRVYIPDIEQAANAGKVKIRIHVGENMAHCWPMLGFTREARETRAEIYEIIRTA